MADIFKVFINHVRIALFTLICGFDSHFDIVFDILEFFKIGWPSAKLSCCKSSLILGAANERIDCFYNFPEEFLKLFTIFPNILA